MQAITATVSRKMTVRPTQRGSGAMPKAPSNSPDSVVRFTGKNSTKRDQQRQRDRGERRRGRAPVRTRRNPMPIPRKLASSTKFVR